MYKKIAFLCICSLAMLTLHPTSQAASDNEFDSKIVSVKLYQNQAKITRKATVNLQKGVTKIVLTGLPKNLYDWSIRGSLPKQFQGKIMSLEVAQKALLKKRETRILTIEKKLKKLRENDLVLVDELKNISSQDEFLNSILDFTKQAGSKELATRIPQVAVWDKTLEYVSSKKKHLASRKRQIEKDREELGKKIQKCEFELSQIAGDRYFRNYQSLNNAILTNRSKMMVQQFADNQDNYANINDLLKKPEGKVEIEKQLIATIHSLNAETVTFYFDYVIPDTYWKMKYDIRASNEQKKINLFIYADVYQKTGENWQDVKLSLSTGSPVSSITPPTLYPWYLDIQPDYSKSSSNTIGGASGKADYFYKKSYNIQQRKEKKQLYSQLYDAKVNDKGPFLEIQLPIQQTILSSNKYQKKYIKDFTIKGENVEFYYEITPQISQTGFLRVKAKNSTTFPWLSGESQIFLENEYMGKTDIPNTPQGKKEDIVLRVENRIIGIKELVKKYEDTAGVFGGNRRIRYKYRLTVENNLKETKQITLYDMVPVSRNKKIEVEIQNLSIPFDTDKTFIESTKYEQGIRRWKLSIAKNEKKEITYEVIITFDKDTNVQGLR